MAITFSTSVSEAQTVVASQDFDGGATNFTSGFDPSTDNQDGGPGNFWGAGSMAAWPQGLPADGGPGVPFAVCDDSVEDVSGQGFGSPFPGDVEGVFGLDADPTNAFFCISDTDQIGDGSAITASWTFDISSSSGPLQLCIDMGQQSNGDSFGGFDAGFILFEYSVDGGAFETAFSCDPFDSLGSGFEYRGNDEGLASPTDFVCRATGPNTITKISAETGSADTNTILDRTPPNGSANAGVLDTFVTDINGTGSSIEVRVTASIAFEAMVFDNIKIVEPGGGGGTVAANNLTVFRGNVVAGGLAETQASDDARLQLNPGFTINNQEAPVWLVFDGTLPNDSPAGLSIDRESQSGTPGLTATTEAWNWNTGSYVELDSTDENFNTDAVVNVDITAGVADYVEGGTGNVRTRIGWRKTGFTINFPWEVRVDQVIWTFN